MNTTQVRATTTPATTTAPAAPAHRTPDARVRRTCVGGCGYALMLPVTQDGLYCGTC